MTITCRFIRATASDLPRRRADAYDLQGRVRITHVRRGAREFWFASTDPPLVLRELRLEHGDRIVRDEDFAERYSQRMGPLVDRAVVVGQGAAVAALEPASRMSRGWITWRGICGGKVALGLPVDHQGWHPTSLTKYRARLLLNSKEGLARWRTRCSWRKSSGCSTGPPSRSLPDPRTAPA